MGLEEMRTDMARERTKLAWIRTSLTSFIAGVTSLKLFESAAWLGWLFIGLAVILVIRGLTKRFE